VRKKVPFDSQKFLAKVGDGKTILTYRKNQIVFSQGEVADAVFYISKAISNSSWFPSRAKKLSSLFWVLATFLAKDV
jgi:hypothetical protein